MDDDYNRDGNNQKDCSELRMFWAEWLKFQERPEEFRCKSKSNNIDDKDRCSIQIEGFVDTVNHTD